MLKGIYSIFKFSPARREDYLKINEILVNHESKSAAYLFPQNFFGHRWLENGKTLNTAIDLHCYFKRYLFLVSKRGEKVPPKDECLATILDKMVFPLHLATLQFSLFMCNEIELFLTFFKQNGQW